MIPETIQTAFSILLEPPLRPVLQTVAIRDFYRSAVVLFGSTFKKDVRPTLAVQLIAQVLRVQHALEIGATTFCIQLREFLVTLVETMNARTKSFLRTFVDFTTVSAKLASRSSTPKVKFHIEVATRMLRQVLVKFVMIEANFFVRNVLATHVTPPTNGADNGASSVKVSIVSMPTSQVTSLTAFQVAMLELISREKRFEVVQVRSQTQTPVELMMMESIDALFAMTTCATEFISQ